ncbi:DNA polymerase I [Legionella micdadei]|uniref:DNA polymerase I n=1 Tax=Legionella micdadei TaxID=451 RepID=A0A098GIC4_LEGMI|nr:DNA polymerase I [Legionella micdadei]ARG98653.1 DNA polymerase I [Legionella micdadei]KTD28860.1 DNA polymerase I [Legionella micdadei]CEG62239.1 DNA polymerase I [Legionella micdadei]SCY06406.1 DNA polymerase I [Legionella micdadei]
MSCPLILIDGSSYFFRAFHALPPLTNSKGQPTGAVYGVANMVKKIIKDYKPEQIAVVFDSKGKTFRDEWYPEYKAHRPPMPNDLQSQFKPLLDLLEAMGLPILIVEGVEADDVIGTLAHSATEQKQTVLISTSDKDMAQLVNEHVTLINTMTNQTLDTVGVTEKFGVHPSQIVDYLALIGDSIDNVPGVPKCGPKTAMKWLQEYQSLDNLIVNSHAITGKIGDYLRASIPHLPLSKKLVTIKTDVELPLTLADLKPKEPNREMLLALLRELEFRNWLKELLEQQSSQEETTPSNMIEKIDFTVINTETQLTDWIGKLKSSPMFCINVETTSNNVMEAEIVGIALAIEEGKPAYLPLAHKDGSEQLSRDKTLFSLKPLLENEKIGKIGQNIKYDYNVFKRYGIHVKGILSDPMLESYVLNSNASRHDMDSLSLKYLGHKPLSNEDILGKGTKQLSFDAVPVMKAALYAAEFVDLALKLHHKLYSMLDDRLRTVLNSIEIPLLTVLADMEYDGVLVDQATLAKHGERLKERMAALEEEALCLAGKPFNLNSPKQLQEILFDTLKIPVLTKTPTGQPSTAEAVLQELAFDFRLPAVILEYRGLSKLISTYIDALPKTINPQTQRVHTSYNQAVAATGRLSSSDPNLQNIPIRSEEGRLIRKAFVAPADHFLLAADYSQIELRIMAHLSQDANLLQAFINNWDIHAATASEIFQVPLMEVTGEQRRRAKAVNFGLIYGMSSFGLAKRLGIERQDAQYYMDRYFQRYPGVLDYMERTRKQAHQQGYVETLFGRRLYLPEINTQNLMRQKAAERAAINAPMQGTAADIIKKAMIALAQWQSTQEKPLVKMIMQVHDELIFEVHETAVDAAKETIRNLMEHTVQLSVPLSVSIGVGRDWDEAH